MINEETIDINDLRFTDEEQGDVDANDLEFDGEQRDLQTAPTSVEAPDQTDDFSGQVTMGLGGTTTAPSNQQTTTTEPADTAVKSAESETSSSSSEPTQKELDLFKRLHNSSYNPKSPMDKRKMEQLRQASQQVGSEDISKLAPAAYNLQSKDKTTAYTPRSSSKQTAIKNATSPASPVGGPTYYVRTGFNQYRPAVQADVSSNQQLFMKNPNPVGRGFYPYVKVDSRSVRRASPAR